MDTKHKHRCWGKLVLEPIFHDELPEVEVCLDDIRLFYGGLDSKKTLEFDEKLPVGPHQLTVRFLNKKDQDTVVEKGLDKAVIIESVSFVGIESQRFVWSGIYTPQYPEPWYSQQSSPPPAELPSHTYLSWNGVWKLNFTSPIFTWIHQIEGMGWIYD